MALTDFGTLSAAQKKVWAAETWQAGRDQSFFFSNGFIGKNDADMNAVIQRVTQLTETERGQECVMQLVQDLQSDGVVGDNDLEGNEEAMVNDAVTIRIDQLRHGVKSKGEMSEQATVIRFRAQGKEKLAFWIADKLDELMFLTLSGRAYTLKTDGTTRVGSALPSLSFAADVAAATANRIVYAGSSTSEGTITAADKFSWETVVRAQTFAQEKRLRPIRSGGKDYYCMVVHPRQGRDLKLDPTYQTILRTAEKPGGDHPLLKGGFSTIDGVVIYQHNKVFNTSGLAGGTKWGAGGAVDGAQAMLLGAQAGGVAMLGSVFWRESDNTDYGNKKGIGVGRKIGLLKPRFKSVYDANTSQDFGTLAVKTAAAK